MARLFRECEGAFEIDHLAVDGGGDARLGEPRADAFGHIERSRTVRILLDRTVGKLHRNHGIAFRDSSRRVRKAAVTKGENLFRGTA